MKIELRNVSYLMQDGEKSPAYTAAVYINDHRAATASNAGYGAATEIRPLSKAYEDIVLEADHYCSKTPLFIDIGEGGNDFPFTRTLSLHIDQLLMGKVFRDEIADPGLKLKHEQIRRKSFDVEDKSLKSTERLQRDMQKGILIGQPDDYYLHEYGMSLARIVENPDCEAFLVPELMKIVHQFGGHSILNSNIPEGILKRAGLDPSRSAMKVKAVTLKPLNAKKGIKKRF